MLLTPRTYSLAQTPDAGNKDARSSYFTLLPSRKELLLEAQRAKRMLLLHQTGAVKVGEVVRYTVTYTPAEDRILPSPATLHVRIRNTAAMPLRAAYLHGPYTLHVAAYPSSFNPNKKIESPKSEGVPEFEPNLKAGGYWNARLTVPEHIRESGGNAELEAGKPKSATWIIEIASQIIFSNSASVSYELLVARDERSLDLGFTAVTGNTHGVPGQVQDHQQGKASHKSKHAANPKGVYSKAVKLVVDDTTSLWNKPELPQWKEEERPASRKSKETHRSPEEDTRKQKKIHLVIVTHGLHSNLGADMLYLKESIDATARQAREDRKRRKEEDRGMEARGKDTAQTDVSTAPLSGGQDRIPDNEDDDDEEIVVRGFDKNVIRTERGIQYLGKRLAKYVLEMTYPDQPYLPIKKPKLAVFSPGKERSDAGIPAHAGSSVRHPSLKHEPRRAYKFTSISFVGHSLGGLVQTYAIAYIYKHSPQFFENIKPINFITMASPLLGLSNENPMYVKFALDFGLVGRTGQDLGLTWRAPTVVRSGWTAMVSGLGGQSQQEDEDSGTKPLLRILPTGPAHVVLRMFRNRTLYSNVVNDGIVPLRTSCLLFLDWKGLGRVEKARRDNGLIGTVAVWGFGQLAGQSTSPNPSRVAFSDDGNDGPGSPGSPSFSGDDTAVPQPGADAVNQDDEAQAAAGPSANQWLEGQKHESNNRGKTFLNQDSTIMQLWSYVRPSGKHTNKDKKMFNRSQTVAIDQGEAGEDADEPPPDIRKQGTKRPQATRGDSLANDPSHVAAPPKTTIFESAGDLLSPPVPPQSWIIDPSTRDRTIFHDRVYHPEDIPPPLTKKKAGGRSFSGESSASSQSTATTEEINVRVEEKIARAYHKDLSWRKVLVRLEPDAHNNIVVRRMFANAYGWPVIKHLCDTHFADTYSAQTRDEHEPATDRAKGVEAPVRPDGEHVKGQEDTKPPVQRTESELREVADELAPLNPRLRPYQRTMTGDSTRSKDSTFWDDMYFEGTSDEDDDDDDRNAIQKFLQLQQPKKPTSPTSPKTPDGQGTSEADISDFLSARPRPVEVHRGLGVSPSSTSKSASAHEPDSLESYGGGGAMLSKGRQAASPPTTPTTNLNLSGVGLRSSMDVPSPSSQEGRARSGSGGVIEQVARYSYSTDRK
jgi:hypothetical protein